MSWYTPILLLLSLLPLTSTLDCYNTMCQGSGDNNTTYMDCDQSGSTCGVDETGMPTCNPETPGDGVNCTVDDTHDQFYCDNNATGAAVCVYPPKHDCYDTACTGEDTFNTTVISCDQSVNRCVFNETTGEPTCIDTSRGNGVDCSGLLHQDFYCGSDAQTGAATCEQTPSFMCYNNKCVGSGDKNTTYIDCDQSANLCQVNETTGDPVCSPLSRGAGVNCTLDDTNDEYYCENDLETGDAVCVYPPKHDCYDTTCTGIDSFNTTVISCDQSVNRCGLNETGAPICINTTRGNGIDCLGEKNMDYECSSDTETGAATCVHIPTWTCYNQFCRGTGSKNTSWVSCDEAKNKCTVEEDGSPVCVPGFRGSGVNCNDTLGNFYCSYQQDDPATAICRYPEEYSCFNSKCRGIFNNSNVYVDCFQVSGHCDVNPTGFPICVPDSGSTGEGVFCGNDFYCSTDKYTGNAMCAKAKSWKDLWVVFGVAMAVILAMIAICIAKRRSKKGADRQFLLAPQEYDHDH